ncbi:CoA-acylating methylmalonate-semialdehyde dehydrogenase [Aquipuribacter nitratireducens]|uniref:methylmalonate-semialdehyde dehydrogenase (CoA acylating) n=1 Tax=Aquipuribacter nitratireducens TaxID=650104 RepID=A0ABW0GIS5_9MICO
MTSSLTDTRPGSTSDGAPGQVRSIGHWLSGAEVRGRSGRTHPVTDPATGEVTGHVDLADPDEVDDVVNAAAAAGAAWGRLSLGRRTKVLFRFRELLESRAEEVAAVITAEHGKVLSDALGEVSRGLEVVEFACGLPHLLKGEANENVSTRVDIRSLRQPLGVVAVITPFNFPAMVPLWFVPVALAAGNAVILKPSERDPSASLLLARMWEEAGLPAGVLSVLNGDVTTVNALLDHPGVAAASFVGSTPVAKAVYERGTAAGKRVQALGGAKNHMVVLPDADLDLAADAAVNAGFGSAGERCMAISAVVAVGGVADALVDKIAERARGLRTGDGRRGCDMGPLVTAQHRDRVRGYVDAGEAAGARLVVDGRDPEVDGARDGFWLGPTLFDHVTPDMTIYTDEIFGPVLSVVRVESFDDALALVNANPYGNGTAIFTNDGGASRRYSEEVEVGMVGVNVPIPIPMAYYSFGGWKASLFGDSHAHGLDGFRFYTRTKVVTTRWLDPSHAGLDLGFPTTS